MSNTTIKPHIQKLFDIMADYRIDCQRAGHDFSKWTDARLRLIERFKEMGIYDSFDWGPDSD